MGFGAEKPDDRDPTTTTGASAVGHSPPHGRNVAVAAGIASLLTKSILHPIDTIKCRLQSSPQQGGVRAYIARWSGQWAPRYLYAGFGVKLLLYVPFQTVYMSTYAQTKRSLSERLERPETSWPVVIAASLTADVASACIRVPMEAIKMRQQAVLHTGLRDAMQHLRRQGLATTARLFVPQTLVHDAPYTVMQWLLYETLRPWMVAHAPTLLGSAATHAGTFVAGLVTGVVAGLITTPLDVVKTRVVVLRATDPSVTVRQEVRWLFKERGLRGFFLGAGMRAWWISSNLGVYLALFEALKRHEWLPPKKKEQAALAA